jgi:putative addiction module component (TIGR02574 family)
MTGTAKKVLDEALKLPPVDRAELIQRLFQSFDECDSEVDEKWAEEVESRLDAYDKGELTASSAEDVMVRINGE